MNVKFKKVITSLYFKKFSKIFQNRPNIGKWNLRRIYSCTYTQGENFVHEFRIYGCFRTLATV